MDTKQEPLVSVVTPFYNTGEYLEECIQSVLAQTYTHWEYILLDNWSTDNSAEIAERYAAQNSRIHFVKANEFLDQLPNYNRALRMISAESQYCKMVQADDWIFPTCLEEMVKVAQMSPAIGIVGSYTMHENEVGHGGLPFSRRPVFKGRDVLRHYLMNDQNFIGSQTCVLYRSDLVRFRQPFYQGKYCTCEDLDACLELLREVDFGFVFQVLSFCRRNNSSIWTRIDKFYPVLMHRLIMVYKHGPLILTPEDYRVRFAALSEIYYLMLARGLLERRGKDFWQFHQYGLRTVGLQIARATLTWAVFRIIAGVILNPARTAVAVLRKVRRLLAELCRRKR